ncbi:LADA_0B02454g1_1 [Lachancea dasiensis]|uniref:LADA_0B02454g1_1 n=1 Tax=Lachancea dasiensis TaxID=1072105 RepID=A0A1G4IS35_9SACH|nr:LADA_0B02454g1_1 [Lachancea dasiensis]
MLRRLIIQRPCWKRTGYFGSAVQPSLVRLRSTYLSQPGAKVTRIKTEEELAQERLEEQLKSESRFIRWGAIARTEKFTKGMTKYLIGAYIIFLIYGLYFMRKMYAKEKELERLEAKRKEGQANEYEELRIKELRGKMRNRDKLQLAKYRALPHNENEDTSQFDGITLEKNDENITNRKILPARDTTDFYDFKAAEYDEGVNFEEKAIFMGSRRKWLMKHCQGDILEVACGTGRNLKYVDLSKVNSITFMDASEKMMELTHNKFRAEFPNFKKAAFVVGKAENLVDLAASGDGQGVDPETRVKYDTIVEAFGLCSLENPVKSLQNFEKLLKPGGRIVLLEHGRGTYDFVNKILDDRAEKRLETWGCRWNLDLGEILDDSGLEIVEENRTHLGTTWCIVAKRKGDLKKNSELGFVEKYFGSSIKSKIEAYETAGKSGSPKAGGDSDELPRK